MSQESELVQALNPQFGDLIRRAESALENALRVTIDSPEKAAQVSELSTELRSIEKRIEDKRLSITKEARTYVTNVNNYAKEIAVPINKAKKFLSDRLMKWQSEERRKAEEARREQEKARQEALLANKPVEEITRTKAPEPINVIQTRKVLKMEIEDLSKVPRSFMIVDEAAVRDEIRAGRSVPGVKHWYEETAVVRSA